MLMTDDKLEITPDLVRTLVERQFPQWASLPIRPVDVQGWDNRSFRLGETMKIRMPSAVGYVPQVGKENRWLPYLADRLPLSIPRPLALGAADPDYPWPWSIQSWIEGEPATRSAIAEPIDFAGELAGFLMSLRQIAVDGAPIADRRTGQLSSGRRSGDL